MRLAEVVRPMGSGVGLQAWGDRELNVSSKGRALVSGWIRLRTLAGPTNSVAASLEMEQDPAPCHES